MQYKLSELTKGLDVSIQGDADCLISGVSTIQAAKGGDLSFLTNPRYRKFLADTQATAIILNEKDAKKCSVTAVISDNPYYTYAKMSEKFLSEPTLPSGIHPSSVVGEDCKIDDTAAIGPNVVVGNRVQIGPRVTIAPGAVLGDDVVVGDDSMIDANVSIYYGTQIGKRVHISSGVVIGADGFGFANEKGFWHKVPQLGAVIIGDDVSIGSNTAIDRGAVDDTVIGNGVKLDNLIQIGHNVKIGEGTVVAGTAAISGSVTIGKYCMIGGAACFAGHISVGDKIMITGGTIVTKSLTEPGVYSSGIIGAVPNQDFRKNNVRFHKLGQLMDRVKELESTVSRLTEREQT